MISSSLSIGCSYLRAHPITSNKDNKHRRIATITVSTYSFSELSAPWSHLRRPSHKNISSPRLGKPGKNQYESRRSHKNDANSQHDAIDSTNDHDRHHQQCGNKVNCHRTRDFRKQPSRPDPDIVVSGYIEMCSL